MNDWWGSRHRRLTRCREPTCASVEGFVEDEPADVTRSANESGTRGHGKGLCRFFFPSAVVGAASFVEFFVSLRMGFRVIRNCQIRLETWDEFPENLNSKGKVHYLIMRAPT